MKFKINLNKKVFLISFCMLSLVFIVNVFGLSLFFDCNEDGSHSPSSIYCDGANEDYTYAHYNNDTWFCEDGVGAGDPEEVENILIWGDLPIQRGEDVRVDCKFKCYDSNNEVAMWYQGRESWEPVHYGNCPSAGNYTLQENITLDNSLYHYFVCWISYSGCDSSDTCCGSYYADTDEVSITTLN